MAELLADGEKATSTWQQPGRPRPLTALLKVVNAQSAPQELSLREGSCKVGAGPGCDIIIDDATVSRAHLELCLAAEGVFIQDLGSHNGTFFMEQRIERGVVRLGSRLRLGRAELSIEPERLRQTALAPAEAGHYGELHGTSAAMRQLFGVLQRLEGSLVTVLVEGESGTGKELVARALHANSSVAAGPFVAVNCGALDRELVRSELFGHRRGAFTGAVSQNQGAFHAAAGGTLFLDEVGELPLDVQPVLLRALESGAVVRVGESAECRVDVRILAATHRDLEREVAQGRFREDLYYRLGVVRLRTPPLRERPDDIPHLAALFARDLMPNALPGELLDALRSRPWRGNVRELRSALASYAVLGELPNSGGRPSASLDSVFRAYVDVSRPYAAQKEQFLDTFMRAYVEMLLDRTNGNRSEAARVSGLERSHFNKMANRYKGEQ